MFIIRFLLLALFVSLSAGVHAQTPAVKTTEPAKVTELLQLLDDDEVKAWLAQKQKPVSSPNNNNNLAAWAIEDWEIRTRARFVGLLSAVPRVDAELSRVLSIVRQEAHDSGLAPVSLMLSGIVAVAFCAEWLFRRFAGRAPVFSLLRQAYTEFLALALFTVAIAALFFLFAWPPFVRTVIFYSLVTLFLYRVASGLLGLAQSASMVPAWLCLRMRIFIAVLMVKTAFLGVCERLAVDADVCTVLSIGFSIPLLLIVIEIIWRQRSSATLSLQGHVTRAMRISGAAALWLIWCGGFLTLFWLGAMFVLVPQALAVADKLVNTFRDSRLDAEVLDTRTVLVVRGVRAVIVIAAVDWVAYVWRHSFQTAFEQATLVQTIIAGSFNSVIILLVIDLVWQLSKAFITRRLSDFGGEGAGLSSEAARQNRLHTLLPVFRNALAVTLLCVAVLTVLSQMGVNIGPLVAGAGVVGVAIGFGSQTLVKDVVSGIFYLLDDAFRIGEYIEAGNYTGVVESFSLRSVRLRHSRGAIFTVPFGSLGAIKNGSRGWAIDQLNLRVPFNTDIAKVRQLVKTIGERLEADPEFGPSVIEPLELKGVDEIGESDILLSVSFTCKPGNQAVIRRMAYAMIMEAFLENGIDLARTAAQAAGEQQSGTAAPAMPLQVSTVTED